MDGGGFGSCSHRHKRSYAQMEDARSSPPTLFASEPGSPSFHPQLANLRPSNMADTAHARSRLARYPGDGLDFRRPVSSMGYLGNDPNFIDLTAEDEAAGPSIPSSHPRSQRPPRFARDIIDVSNVIDLDGNERRPASRTPAAAPPESPEIQFVSSRLTGASSTNPIELADDELEIVGVQQVPENQRRRLPGTIHEWMGAMGPGFPHLRAQIQRATHRAAHLPNPAHRNGGGSRQGHVHINFVTPDMDFGMVGFDVGIAGPPTPPAPPTYDAPSKAPAGFTRSPQENDVLICPNCEDELCTGDSDQKKQVWVVKQCGHAYCGDCTANRSSKKTAKGKEKATSETTKPFKKCVVESCESKVYHRSHMIQVFL
ncbi:hypothetical protein EJ04DRAFT_513121 [Polyplosphaeria fusca]|uniref:Uncharacterized protein n=1 Tax=Polyplosphaeria fusca TaxID=682080 RepID=A0A9P4V2S4_9PLEO|nr:hypothetical protein EJ04DRAFT_513121 [Polyplosphaeria fusca]